jgi:D-inositol-3-phosphate glycosyltransferase
VAKPLRIVFSAPAYWPAEAFGGPIWVLRELVRALAAQGHTIDVYTTSLVDLDGRPRFRTRVVELDGATVHYLATPLRFRWMGFTPTLRLHLRRQPRPDVAHVFGFRDPLGSGLASWCRRQRVPYLFEALGMYKPKLRKVGLKRLMDATVVRHVVRGAARVVAASDVERHEYLEGGVPDELIAIRPNGFPQVCNDSPAGRLRRRLGLGPDVPLVLSVGRVARGKGLDLLVEAMRGLGHVHLAIVGPDDGHGMLQELRLRSADLGVDERVHLVGAIDSKDLPGVYVDADVFALASRHENFGMVAAEAAAVGTAVLVTDRCGVAELLGPRGALIVPYEREAVRAGLARILSDRSFREGLEAGGQDVARAWTWARVAELEEELLTSLVRG